MDFFKKPPQWVLDNTPAGMRGQMEGWLWYVILGALGLIGALILLFILRRLTGKKGRFKGDGGDALESPLEEDLEALPKPKPSTGDRQLRIDGVPVRLRLVAVAPAGNADDIDEAMVRRMLEKIVPGLGEIFTGDKPKLRIWPTQLSYEGFAKHFHRNTPIPEGEDEPTPWVILAGRVKLGKQQIMLGLVGLASKPTTIRRRTLDSHEWATTIRVRVRD